MQKRKDKIKVAAYYRISTEHLDHYGSLESQKNILKK